MKCPVHSLCEAKVFGDCDHKIDHVHLCGDTNICVDALPGLCSAIA